MRRYSLIGLVTKNMSSEQRIFWCVQLFLLLVLLNSALEIGYYSDYFVQGIDYCAVDATLSKSVRNSYRYTTGYSSRGVRRRSKVRFTNIYTYEVDGKIYTVEFTDQKQEGYNRTLYYNPADPRICTEYKSYYDLVSQNGFGLIGFIFGQTGLIMVVLMRKSKKREEKKVVNNVGVVLQDDLDFTLNDISKKEETYTFASKEKEEERLSIPFKLTGKTDETNIKSPWDFPDKMNSPKDGTNTKSPWDVQDEMNSEKEIQQQSEFVLYTEEEYQKLKS